MALSLELTDKFLVCFNFFVILLFVTPCNVAPVVHACSPLHGVNPNFKKLICNNEINEKTVYTVEIVPLSSITKLQ